MSERVNLNLDAVKNDGDGLYVADSRADGVVVLEERPDEMLRDDGGYAAFADEDDDRVFRTSADAVSGDVYLRDVETDESVETIFAAEIGPHHLPLETLEDRGLVTLERLN